MLEDTIYCYSGSDVLVNKLNITDFDELQLAERRITNARQFAIQESWDDFTFDADHLKKVHGYLFQDVYDWAGEFRTIDIYKGYSEFCPAENLLAETTRLFSQLRDNNYLVGLERDEFAIEMANFMADLNQLHPFREGNGRTQRLFVQQLAEHAGWDLHLRDIPKNSLQSAMITSSMSVGPLERLIRANCERIAVVEPDRKKELKARQGLFSSIASLFNKESEQRERVVPLDIPGNSDCDITLEM